MRGSSGISRPIRRTPVISTVSSKKTCFLSPNSASLRALALSVAAATASSLPTTILSGTRMAVPFSTFSSIRRSRSISSCSSAAFSLSVNIFRQHHRDLVALVIGQGTLAQHLNHLFELVVGQLSHDVLDYELTRHDGEHGANEVMRARSPHVKQRRLSFRQRAAFFDSLVPELQHVSKHRAREAITDTTGPTVGVSAISLFEFHENFPFA